jgi:phosphinothricin acetyltransferase
MLIRNAVPDLDADACLAIYAPFVVGTAVSFEEQVPDHSEFVDRMRRAQSTHAWMVADVSGETIGFAYGAPHRQRAAYRWSTDTTVYVAPEHRRAGVGRALYSQLLARLAQRGYHMACAGIALPNDASVGLHESLGFVPVGVYRRIGWKAGAWRDVGWWQLELLPALDRMPSELLHEDPP